MAQKNEKEEAVKTAQASVECLMVCRDLMVR